MKYLFIPLLFLSFIVNGQTWGSISKAESFKYVPFRQFTIDLFTNELWFIHNLHVAKLKETGEFVEISPTLLNGQWQGVDLSFIFNQNGVYFCKYLEGIYKLNDNDIELIYPYTGSFNVFTNNSDTLYLTIPFEPYLKISNGLNSNTIQYGDNIFSKNSFFYKSGYTDGNLVKIVGPNPNDFIDYSGNDPEYLSYFFNDIKFSRYTDTLYVAGKQGVCFAYNYDFLDTITPNNTIDMPTSNVLEIEFDHLDRLWAVFGDDNDQAFSIAMLENNTWVNYFDANNSPIQFLHPLGQNGFYGLEIDTMGNVWVCDYANLHTLLSPTTPAWVGIKSEEKESFEISPNPALDILKVNFINPNELKKIQLIDLNGQILFEKTSTSQFEQISVEKLKSGIYFVSVSENNRVAFKKIVKL